ncbi:NlpC/P60 family protein [Streptomyces sp. NPDC090075]|uniref:C40 family peptidase n=1 Tax=Streptomyces sp. NPDC090075 TaxID=3365937 RepID=UPI0038248662
MGKAIASALGLVLLITVLAGAGVGGLLAGFGGTNTQPSSTALADIPAEYLALYVDAAATCPGLDWSVLAAIGKIESDHGRSTLPGVRSGSNTKGARGPMQFLLATFRSVVAERPPPKGGAAPPSPYNAHDAIYTAAAYLCDSGARDGRNILASIKSYNHADWYVSEVLSQAQTYAGNSVFGADNAPTTAALQAINYAQGQLGLPYEWGGDGPGDGDAGFDCSGLTKAAYAAAGITLPRTAQEQYDTGPHVPTGQDLKPGDLVFYGSPAEGIHHVGLYIGGGQMIDAPSSGKKIRIESYQYPGDDYTGATRPAGG